MTDVFLKDENGIKQHYSGIESVSLDGSNNQKETFIQPALQEKSIENKKNGVTEVSADTGYDGLSKVTVKTSVPPTMQDYRFLTPSRQPQKSDWEDGAASYPLFYSTANDTGDILNGLLGAVGFVDGQPPVVSIANFGGFTPTGIPSDARPFYSWQELNAEQLSAYQFGALSYTYADTAVLPVGWSYPVSGEGGKITSFISIDTDTAKLPIGSDVYDSEHFNNYFYELFTLASIKDKAVSVTQNGTTTIRANHAALGIHQVDLTVDLATEEKTVALDMGDGDQVVEPSDGKTISKLTVEKPVTLTAENIKAGVNIGGVDGTYIGSGGSGVQPDWAQNDATAADYVKNRPGGYYGTELAAISISFDGDTTGKSSVTIGGTQYVKVSDDIIIFKEQLLGGTLSIMQSGEQRTITISEDQIAEVEVLPEGIMLAGTAISLNKDLTVDETTTLTKGTWFARFSDTTYVSGLNTPSYKPVFRFSKDFIPYTTPNWTQNNPAAESYIKNRPGGYYFSSGLPSQTFEYDGSKEGKTTDGNYVLVDGTVGVSSGALLYQQFVGAEITINNNGELSTEKVHCSSHWSSTIFFEGDGTFSQAIEWNDAGLWFKDTRNAEGQGKYVSKLVLQSSGNDAQFPEYYLTDEVVKVRNTWLNYILTDAQKKFTSDSIGAVSFYGSGLHSDSEKETARNSIETPKGGGRALCTRPGDGGFTNGERAVLRSYIETPEGDKNSVILYSASNKKYKITVDDNGTICAAVTE
mgnify:CR=1 FL=1